MLHGEGISNGIAIADAFVFSAVADPCSMPFKGSLEECNAFYTAVANVRKELSQLRIKAAESIGEEEAAIFDAQSLILADESSVQKPIEKIIREECLSAAVAVEHYFTVLSNRFAQLSNDYMRERALDMDDLRGRLVRSLLGLSLPDLSALDHPVILVADSLTPSETIGLNFSHVAGFITQSGGRFSHTAILARSLGIPAVSGIDGIVHMIKTGDKTALDGESGEVALHPDEATEQQFINKQRLIISRQTLDSQYRVTSTVTADGTSLQLMANIGSVTEAALAITTGAEGIGLFRSEFLYMGRRSVPNEEEQFRIYRDVLKTAGNLPVVVRTIDIGGDKDIPYLHLPHEDNPFLGYRAIRLCLQETALFRTQLRALLRASVYGNLRIMFPMISSVQELLDARAIFEEERYRLASEHVEMHPYVPLGIMVEIPAAAILATELSRHADFFSIGTNDLTQYTLAVDRGNERIASLYSAYHPAVLRLIAATAAAATKAGIPCGMCGEAACDPKLLPVWLGLGLTELSASTPAILPTRRILGSFTLFDCKVKAEHAIALATVQEVKAFLTEEPSKFTNNSIR